LTKSTNGKDRIAPRLGFIFVEKWEKLQIRKTEYKKPIRRVLIIKIISECSESEKTG